MNMDSSRFRVIRVKVRGSIRTFVGLSRSFSLAARLGSFRGASVDAEAGTQLAPVPCFRPRLLSPASLVALLMMANRPGLAHAACSQGGKEKILISAFPVCLLRAAWLSSLLT
jgi:hypothetical protein